MQPLDHRISEITENRRSRIASREKTCSCGMAWSRPLGICRSEALAFSGIAGGEGKIAFCGLGGFSDVGDGGGGKVHSDEVEDALFPCVPDTFAELGELLVIVWKRGRGY